MKRKSISTARRRNNCQAFHTEKADAAQHGLRALAFLRLTAGAGRKRKPGKVGTEQIQPNPLLYIIYIMRHLGMRVPLIVPILTALLSATVRYCPLSGQL